MIRSTTPAKLPASRLARRSQGREFPKLDVLDALAFVAPILSVVEFDIISQLYLTELLLVALLPFLIVRYGRRLSARLPRTAIALLVVWLLSQIATDLVRESTFEDYARGWALIGFTLVNFCALYLLLAGKPKRLVLFAAGAVLGGIVAYLVAPNEFALGDPWKFGYGDEVSWLLVLFAVALAKGRGFVRLWPAALLLLAVATLNFYMGYRSAGGIAFLATCYLAAQVLWRRRSASGRIRTRQLIMLGIVAVIGAVGALQLYEHSAQSGWLGEDARQKYEMQSSGGYGLLLGGRTEILVSSRAVLESPVIGHGSGAKDCGYAALYAQLKREAGYSPGDADGECLIPTHSHLMGAWVQAGILGAVFWVWALTLPIRTLTRLYTAPQRLTPLVALLAFLLIWDIFFSPFGAERRFMTPFYIVLMISFLPEGMKMPPVRLPHLRSAAARERKRGVM